MARSAVTPTPFVPNGNVADPAGTATVAGAGNGQTIAYQGGKSIMLRVANASGGSGTVTIKAGSQPSAPSSGQGDLVVTVANTTTQWVGPFESARFAQPDGSLALDTSVVMTVTPFTLDGRYVG